MKNSIKELANVLARNELILPFPCLMYTSLVSKWSENPAKKTKQNKISDLVVCSTIQHCEYLQKPPLLLTFPLSLLLNQPPQKFCPVKNNDDDMAHIWYKELTTRMPKVKTFLKYA